MLQHLEGGPWHFLTVARYSSWEDFAKAEKADVGETLKPDGGWLGVRNHSTYHNDTITDRMALTLVSVVGSYSRGAIIALGALAIFWEASER